MKKNYTCTVILALMMILSLFFSCSKTEQASKTGTAGEAGGEAGGEVSSSVEKMKAAIIVPMLTVEALQAICESFEANCAKYGIEADSASADVSIPRYIELIQNYVADEYDILVIIPLDATGLEDVVVSARKAGTKIVMLSTYPSYEVDGGMICDYETTGYAVAKMAVAWLDQVYSGAAADSVGFGVVASETPEEYLLCKKAMISTINASKAGYVAYVSGEEVGGSVDAGYNFAQEAMTADPNIRIFVCNEPDSAKGVNNYLMSVGDLKRKDYAIFSINTDETAMKLVAQSSSDESLLRGLIPYGNPDVGGVAAGIVNSILAGEKTPYWVYDEIFTHNSFGWEYTK